MVGLFTQPRDSDGAAPAHIVPAADIRAALDKSGANVQGGPVDASFEAAMHQFKNQGYAASIPNFTTALQLFPGHLLATQNLAEAKSKAGTAPDAAGESAASAPAGERRRDGPDVGRHRRPCPAGCRGRLVASAPAPADRGCAAETWDGGPRPCPGVPRRPVRDPGGGIPGGSVGLPSGDATATVDPIPRAERAGSRAGRAGIRAAGRITRRAGLAATGPRRAPSGSPPGRIGPPRPLPPGLPPTPRCRHRARWRPRPGRRPRHPPRRRRRGRRRAGSASAPAAGRRSRTVTATADPVAPR